MQGYLVTTVIPTVLAGLQSITEETLSDHFGDSPNMAARLRTLRANNTIDDQLVREAHHWRLVRNVLMHGGGQITQQTVDEAGKLHQGGAINFKEFSLWGPLLDAGYGGVLVPITAAARTPPYAVGTAAKRIQIIAGEHIEVGLGDVLAAGSVWAQILAQVTSSTAQP
jgi:hypothetical protein